MKKFLEVYKKISFPLMLAVTTILLFFSPYISWLWIVASVLNFGFYLTCSVTQMLCATMYYEFFSGIGTFFIVSILEMLAVTIVRYIIDLVKKREKFYVFPFVMTFVIIVIFSCIHYAVTLEGFYQGAILIAFLMSSYLVFIYHKKINVSECFRGLIVGMLVSVLLATLATKIPNYPYDFIIGGRWYMFALNVNHISMLCLFAIAFYIQQINFNKNSLIRNLLCIIISTAVGITTLSKAFLIVWILLMIYLFVSLIIKFKKKSFIILIPLILFMLVIAIIFKDKVFTIIKRFIELTFGNSLIDKILTGRVTVWREFLDVIISSVWTLLFGVGLFTQNPAEFNTHNSYLFLLHRFGFIGIILLMILIYAYAKNSKSKFKITVKNSLTLFVFLLLSCEELLLSDRFMFFLFFAVLLIAHNGEDFEPKTTGKVIDYVETKLYFYLCKLISYIKLKFPIKKATKAAGVNEIAELDNIKDVSQTEVKDSQPAKILNNDKQYSTDLSKNKDIEKTQSKNKNNESLANKTSKTKSVKTAKVIKTERPIKSAQKSKENNKNNQ